MEKKGLNISKKKNQKAINNISTLVSKLSLPNSLITTKLIIKALVTNINTILPLEYIINKSI